MNYFDKNTTGANIKKIREFMMFRLDQRQETVLKHLLGYLIALLL